MSDARKLFKTMFAYKTWADFEMFDQLQKTPETTRNSLEFGKAVRLLNHIHVVDKIFQANLEKRSHGYTALNTDAIPALADLSVASSTINAWFTAFVEDLSPEKLDEVVSFTFISGGPGLMTRAEILMHVITHGVYHRGAVGEMVSKCGIKPPTDGLTSFPGLGKMERRPGSVFAQLSDLRPAVA